MNEERKKIHEKGFEKLDELETVGKDFSSKLLSECLANPYQAIRIQTIEQVSKYPKDEYVGIFGIALNDKCDFVAERAAEALAKINSDEALQILSDAFFYESVARPHYIANAISEFGARGKEILWKGIKSDSPNIRYYSVKFWGDKDDETSLEILKEIAENDNAKTSFGGLVSTSAKRRLKVLTKTKIQRDNWG